MHAHLIKYIEKYGKAVKVISKTFLSGKDQTLDDYISCIQQPRNCADELSLYLCTFMCQKQVAVITKTGVWYTGKLNNNCDDFIQISDCDMVLVYLRSGVFRGTKEKPFLYKPTGPAVPKTKLVKDDYIPQGLYEQESARRPHTRSMGSPQPLASGALGSSTEPASESSESPDEPDNTPHTPPKPKRQPRKAKQNLLWI